MTEKAPRCLVCDAPYKKECVGKYSHECARRGRRVELKWYDLDGDGAPLSLGSRQGGAA